MQVSESAVSVHCILVFRNCLHNRVVGSNDPVVRCGFNNGYMTCQEIITEREISCVSIHIHKLTDITNGLYRY